MSGTATTVERCQLTDVFNVNADLPEALRATVEKYIEPFAKPIWAKGSPKGRKDDIMGLNGILCWNCSKPLSGLLGTFVYGIQHGEGRCSSCKWPGRSNHYIKDSEGGEDLAQFVFILQYHPDFVEVRKETRRSEIKSA